MKVSFKCYLKTFICAATISLALLACNDSGTNNPSDTEQNATISSSSVQASSNSIKQPSCPFENPSTCDGLPIMNSKVVSYKRVGYYDWGQEQFIFDNDLLKSWFPHIFNDDQAESECNYFGLCFQDFGRSYYLFSEDMNLYRIACTQIENPGIAVGGWSYNTMLICDDKAGTLRKSINLDSTRTYNVPNWICRYEEIMPNWEEPNWEKVYF